MSVIVVLLATGCSASQEGGTLETTADQEYIDFILSDEGDAYTHRMMDLLGPHTPSDESLAVCGVVVDNTVLGIDYLTADGREREYAFEKFILASDEAFPPITLGNESWVAFTAPCEPHAERIADYSRSVGVTGKAHISIVDAETMKAKMGKSGSLVEE